MVHGAPAMVAKPRERMSDTVVVTGGAGFIGAHLTRKLIALHAKVHIITRPGGSLWRLNELQKQINVHPVGLSDEKRLRGLIRRIQPQYVFHVAAYGSYPTQRDAETMVQTNVVGTLRLLRSVRNAPVRRVVVVGSSSEYGKKDTAMKESDTLVPNNLYAATKAAATHIALAYAAMYAMPIKVLRLFNVYGPYEEKGRLVRSVIESVLSGKAIRLATGKEARDFIHTDDVVDAMLTAAKSTKGNGGIFNVGTGVETTIADLARMVITTTGTRVPIRLNVYPGRPWDTLHWRADMRKTRAILGWKPRIPLAQGLKETISWYKKETKYGQ
jgi:nucleoside-diphosphate-sugar epimerase